MQKTFRQFLLILFVFLQCLSPLAHAHVGGHDAGRSLWNVHAQAADSHVERGEGAVVSMPHAHPAGDSPLVSEPALEALGGLPRIGVARPVSLISAGRSQGAASNDGYVLAWSQAPPRTILPA